MNQIVIYDARCQQWLQFKQPTRIVKTRDLKEVADKLQLVNELVREEQLYGVGFISYEAAAGFDGVLVTRKPTEFPLLWFGLYSSPKKITLKPPSAFKDYNLNWSPTITKKEYDRAISQIKHYISCGDTYQVNYTMRLEADFAGDSWEYFRHLVAAQQANYSAYLDLEDFTICSASPELFFTWDGERIVTRPMKGTSARGYDLASDRKLARWLQNSAKNRAENVMIVDMLRNDLARVAELNTVEVPTLFEVEQYPTLWQMTSTVTARTRASLTAIMTALFPCASITGAPKSRTMEIIRQLETTPRNIYTGTIGFISPEDRAQFNVAIRTVLIDKKTNRAEYGVGGGIVWDSASASEYEECQIKARVLLNRNHDFELLETILWTPDRGYFLLDYHLKRLKDSALYFNFAIDLPEIEGQLLKLANSLPDKPYKIRLKVDKQGKINLESTIFIPDNCDRIISVCIAKQAIDLHDSFLYHKTTKRDFYQKIGRDRLECDDVLLWNERQEITETCIANIVVKLNNKLLTPPVESGLLAGTFRAYLLEQKEIKESIITLQNLSKCQAVYRINSLRKWQRVRIVTGKR